MLSHLDLSWTKLSPEELVKLSEVLKNEDAYPLRNIRNLNISYNSLYFDETNQKTLPSEEFIENMIEYVNNSKVINHLDISGMNLGRNYNPDKYLYQSDVGKHNSNAPILTLALAISQNEFMLGIHMSDNGLRKDEEVLMELLDMFGLDEACTRPPANDHKLNRRVGN